MKPTSLDGVEFRANAIDATLSPRPEVASRRRHRRDRVKFNEDAASAPGYSLAAYRIALKFAPATGSSILMLTTKWASPRNFDNGTSFPLKGSVTSKSFAGAGCVSAAGGAAAASAVGAAAGGASSANACSATRPALAPALQRIAARRSRARPVAGLAARAKTAIRAKVLRAIAADNESVADRNLYGDAAPLKEVFDALPSLDWQI